MTSKNLKFYFSKDLAKGTANRPNMPSQGSPIPSSSKARSSNIQNRSPITTTSHINLQSPSQKRQSLSPQGLTAISMTHLGTSYVRNSPSAHIPSNY